MTAVPHPPWCDPQRCDVADRNLPTRGGTHRSTPIQLDLRRVRTSRGEITATVAYLTRAACAWDTETFLHLITEDDDLTLPLSQAGGLLHQLAELVGRDNH